MTDEITATCPHCRMPVDPQATICPHCRGKIVTPESRKKQNRQVLMLILLVMAVCCLCFAPSIGFFLRDGRLPTRPESEAGDSIFSLQSEVTVRVTGTVPEALISYSSKLGNLEQETEATVPWERTFQADLFEAVGVTAQSMSDENHTIRCEIIVDGNVVESADGSGAFAMVGCTALIGE